MRKPSATMPIIIAILAVVGIVFANVIAGKNTPKTPNEMEQEEQANAAKNAPSPGAQGGAKSASAPSSDVSMTTENDGNDLVLQGAGGTSPAAPSAKDITVGFEWTPELQADPSTLTKLVEKVKAGAPGAQVRLVNVDETASVPPGISVNSKVVAPLGTDGNLSSGAADAAIAEIKKAK